jgi:hypothetical protein
MGHVEVKIGLSNPTVNTTLEEKGLVDINSTAVTVLVL